MVSASVQVSAPNPRKGRSTHPELMNIKVGNDSEKRGINVPLLLQQIGRTGRKWMRKQQGWFQDRG